MAHIKENVLSSLSQSFSVNRLREQISRCLLYVGSIGFCFDWQVNDCSPEHRGPQGAFSRSYISSLTLGHITQILCRGDVNYVRTLRQHNLNLMNHFSDFAYVSLTVQTSCILRKGSLTPSDYERQCKGAVSSFSCIIRCKMVLKYDRLRLCFRSVWLWLNTDTTLSQRMSPVYTLYTWTYQTNEPL